MLLLLVSTAIFAATYGLIAFITPQSYAAELDRSLDVSMENLVRHFDTASLEECKRMLRVFSEEYNANIQLFDAAGHRIDFGSPVAFSRAADIPENTVSSAAVHRYYFSTHGSDARYWIEVLGSLQRVNLFSASLFQILPWVAVIVLLLAVTLSWLLSRYLTRPILRLSAASKRLAALEFDTHCRNSRADELGILADSLNELSERLSAALQDLRTANAALKLDMAREKELEQQQLDFFSAVSHELKTPITVIKGQLQGMICKVGGYKDRDKYLVRAYEVAETMEQLVQEILTVSRLRAPDFPMQPHPVDLRNMVADAIETYEALAMQKNSLICRQLDAVPAVQANGPLLDKAIRNILSNAVQYSPPESRIRVCLSLQETASVLVVENTGVSIPKDEIPKLFEAFVRRESSRNRETGGSGLGLYLVKMILELHGFPFFMRNISDGIRFTICFQPDSLQSSTR